MSAGSQLNWDAKNIPQAIKQWLGTESLDVRNGFNTAVENLASHNDDVAMFTGDGAYHVTLRTGIIINAFHKRFAGNSYAIIYNYGPRRDGNGRFLNVVAIAEHHGHGNGANNYRIVVQ